MTDRDDTIALLEAAAARLDAVGWRRGGVGGRAGPNCVAGALIWASTALGIHQVQPARDAWHQANRVGRPMVLWNDQDCPDGATAADSLRTGAKWLADNVPADSD